MKFDAQQYYASLVELSKDSGLIGQILRRYLDLLPAADKWAEQNADFQKNKEDPNRLPVPDPWQFLIDAPVVLPINEAVFRSAQSQLSALSHLIHIAEGIATLKTDWYKKAIEARAKGDEHGFNHAISKIADAHVLNEHVQADVRKQNNPELLEQMERTLNQRRMQLVHRGKKDKIEQLKKWPSWKDFRKSNRLPVILVEWWVRCGVNCVPGLMFWRNEALTKFLKVHLDQSNLDSQSVKKIRQQLGLIPVGDKEHFVWDFSMTTNSEGNREIKGFRRNGKQSFCGVISSEKQISAAVMTAFGSS